MFSLTGDLERDGRGFVKEPLGIEIEWPEPMCSSSEFVVIEESTAIRLIAAIKLYHRAINARLINSPYID
jgi:hypothetical protein